MNNKSIININDHYENSADYKEQVIRFIESFDREIFDNELGRFESEEKNKIKNDFFCKVFDIVFKIRAGELYSPHKDIFSEMIELTLEEKLYYENLPDIYDFLPELIQSLVKKEKEYLFDPFILFLQKNNTYIKSDYERNLFIKLIKNNLMNPNLEIIEPNGFKESVVLKNLLKSVNSVDNEQEIDNETLCAFIDNGWNPPSKDTLLGYVLRAQKPKLMELVIKNNLVDINASFDISNDDGETTVKEHILDYYRSTTNYHHLTAESKDNFNHTCALFFDNGLQLDLMHQGYLTTLAHLTDEIYEKMNVNIFENYHPVFRKQQDYTGMSSNVHENALDYFIGDFQIKVAKSLYDYQKYNILKEKSEVVRLIEKSLMVFEYDNVNAILIEPLSEKEKQDMNDFALMIFHDYQDMFSEKEIEKLLIHTMKSPIQGGFNSRIEKELISNSKTMPNDDFKNKINRL